MEARRDGCGKLCSRGWKGLLLSSHTNIIIRGFKTKEKGFPNSCLRSAYQRERRGEKALPGCCNNEADAAREPTAQGHGKKIERKRGGEGKRGRGGGEMGGERRRQYWGGELECKIGEIRGRGRGGRKGGRKGGEKGGE